MPKKAFYIQNGKKLEKKQGFFNRFSGMAEAQIFAKLVKKVFKVPVIVEPITDPDDLRIKSGATVVGTSPCTVGVYYPLKDDAFTTMKNWIEQAEKHVEVSTIRGLLKQDAGHTADMLIKKYPRADRAALVRSINSLKRATNNN